MGRLLAVVAVASKEFAGVNLVLTATRTMPATENGAALAASVARVPSTSAAVTPAPTVPRPVPATTATTSPPAPPPTPEPFPPPPLPAGPPPPEPYIGASPADPTPGVPFFTVAVAPRGIGCAGEPFATAFAISGFTPGEVDVTSCEIVNDIPGARPEDQVCAQVSGPGGSRSIHVAQRTIDGDCRRDAIGVTVHEIGHAWHLAEPARFWRVIDTFGLDRRAEASLEVVAECFVEAVGHLDTACSPQGAGYVRDEIAAGRRTP